ncbi:MAG: hypothetical protein R3190_04575, partial [Thermoanaerobaculia bacterium]|nr:hypothetical protein [Thermoanaerobaculia bacterium]
VPRLRLGIGPAGGFEPGADLVDFVLGPFAPAEAATAEAQVRLAADACELWVEEGMEAAMNRYNGSRPESAVEPVENEEE